MAAVGRPRPGWPRRPSRWSPPCRSRCCRSPLIDTAHGAGVDRGDPAQDRISQAISEWGAEHPLPPRDRGQRHCSPASRWSVIVAVLLIVGGDSPDAGRGTAVAAAIGGFVLLAPLALGRRPGLLPVAQRDAGGRPAGGRCSARPASAPRTRLLGSGARGRAARDCSRTPRSRVQTHAVPRAARLARRSPGRSARRRSRGRSSPPTGTTAIPLKIYLPRRALGPAPVDSRCGSARSTSSARTKRLRARGRSRALPAQAVRSAAGQHAGRRSGPAQRLTPTGTAALVARFRVDNWVIGVRAGHPITVTINQLSRSPAVLPPAAGGCSCSFSRRAEARVALGRPR